uniref:LIM domain-containing protein n=1 Tax=Salmonella sp. s54925 TaxID=3159674 RepID=UPI0039817F36
ETHYNELFGEVCFKCNHGIVGEVVNALEKFWCVNHFTCSGCDTQLTLRSKFHEFDMKPLCRKCYEKMPLEMKKRLRRAELGQPSPAEKGVKERKTSNKKKAED